LLFRAWFWPQIGSVLKEAFRRRERVAVAELGWVYQGPVGRAYCGFGFTCFVQIDALYCEAIL